MEQNEGIGVQEMIKLPKDIKISPQLKLFKPLVKIKQSDNITPLLVQKMQQVYQALSNEFYCYENTNQFYFNFPQSKFEEKKTSIDYEKYNIVQDQDTFKDKLNQDQLQQIAEYGEFDVKSNNKFIKLPYRWKINDRIMRGRKVRVQIWRQGLANIYDLICNGIQSVTKKIPEQICQLWQIPSGLFGVIFGAKRLSLLYGVDYDRLISLDFFEEVVTQCEGNVQGWGKQFFQMMYVIYNSKMDERNVFDPTSRKQFQKKRDQIEALKKEQSVTIQKRLQNISVLKKVNEEFIKKWEKSRKKIINQILDVVSEEYKNIKQESIEVQLKKQIQRDAKVLERAQDKKFTMYLTHIEKQLQQNYSTSLIGTIVSLLRLFQIIFVRLQKLEKQKELAALKITQQVQAQYPIRSLSLKFLNLQTTRRYEIMSRNINQHFYENLMSNEEFKSNSSDLQKKIYLKFQNFRKDYKKRLEAKQAEKKNLFIPSRTFYSTYKVLPPYQKVVTTYENGVIHYTLIKQRPMTIDTRTHFWKIKLYIMRLKCWTINCFIFLVGQALYGPLGLRCLYGKDQFQYDYDINYTTGQRISHTRPPFIKVFLAVLEGVQHSREEFEAQPDRGIFGKKFSRIFNYIQVYFFRLFIVGILIVLILYPIGILLNAILSTFFVITVWIWTPIIMTITYLFNILIYQFQSNYIPQYSLWKRSFPLPAVIFFILKWLVVTISYLLHFLLSPLYGLFLLIIRLFQRIFRTFTDKLMYIFFKYLGRTPSNNTSIAWKVSGPGMSKTFFMSLKQADVYVLTQAELEKIFMQKLIKLYTEQIFKHQEKFNTVMNIFLSPYTSNSLSSAKFPNHNRCQLMDRLNNQNYAYMQRYPRRPRNVRFTQQQIDNYLENCENIVKNFVDKKKMGSWVFKQYNIEENDYAELTRKIWINLFQCGEEIFQPLEKMDNRFNLSDVSENYGQMSDKVQAIKRALDGQVTLHKHVVKVGKFRCNVNTLDPKIFTLQRLWEINSANSVKNVATIFNEKLNEVQKFQNIFAVNLNSKEIKQYENYHYKQLKVQNHNLIQ